MPMLFFKRLFSRAAKAPPKPATEPQTAPVIVTPPPLSAPLDPLAAAQSLANGFNNLLLEQSEAADVAPNEPEQFIIDRLQHLLTGNIPDSVVPRMPQTGSALLKELANANVTMETILAHLKRDPAMASEVLRIANSPLFRTSHKVVENLDRAIVILGLVNLKAIVSAVVMKPLIEIKPVYFQLFGQNLWQHSLDCASAAQILAKRKGADPFNAYLVGLLHDVGKLAIFRLLTESFRHFHPDLQPRGAVFAKIIREQSDKLSLKILESWNLADYLIQAVQEQLQPPLSPACSIYGRVLWEANRLAEFRFIAEREIHSHGDLQRKLAQFDIVWDQFALTFPEDKQALQDRFLHALSPA